MRTETLEIACYGLFVGLLGLLVWEGWQHKTRQWPWGPTTKKGWHDLRAELRDKGLAKQPDDTQWKYTARYKDWWSVIETANWTGKQPPEPVATTSEDPGKKPVPVGPLKPLADIFELRTILANGDDENRIKIQYKDPNVQVPATEFAPMDAVAAAGNTVATPTGNAFQDLVAGDSLYAPYASIKFKTVDLAGPAAVFTRPAPEGKGDTVDERVMLAELGLNEEHIDQETIGKVGARATAGTVADRRHGRDWVDVGDTTKEIDQNAWMISRKDNDIIAKDYERIMTEEMSLSDYRSRRPDRDGKRLQGVAVKRVSRQLARFGIRSGDVLIKLNGKPVKSRTSAIRVGKDEYRRGQRTFELTFLSGGREVVRTYTVPDKKK